MKVLIYSTADISEVFLEACKEVAKYRDVEIVGVYSRSIDKANNYKNKHSLEFSTDDYQKILKSDTFDTVYVCSPNSLHYEHALMALESNKNVIVEKPIALTVSEIDHLYEVASENNVHVFDALMCIYMDTLSELKKFINNEKVHLIDFHYSKQTRHYPKYKEGEYFNVFDKKMGGGAVNDLGVYLVYPLLYLFGLDYNVTRTSIYNKLDADESSCFSGRINDSLFTLRTSKVVYDDRPSTISTTNYLIEILRVGLFDEINIYDKDRNLIKHIKSDKVKMYDEVNYFASVVNKESEYNKEVEALSREVRKFLEN